MPARVASPPLAAPAFTPDSGLAGPARRLRLERLKERLGLKTALVRTAAPGGDAPMATPLSSDGLRPLLLPAALSEVRAATGPDRAAATGFALALAAHRARSAGGALAFIAPDWLAAREGVLYPPALAALGVDLDRFLAVFASDEKTLLWAAEETARTPAIAAAIVEIPAGAKRVDLVATRRLHLAAMRAGAAVILLRTNAAPEPSAAVRRWRVAPAPSAADPDDARAPGLPCWTVELERCRAGARGLFIAEYSPDAEPLLRPHVERQAARALPRAARPQFFDGPGLGDGPAARRAG